MIVNDKISNIRTKKEETSIVRLKRNISHSQYFITKNSNSYEFIKILVNLRLF